MDNNQVTAEWIAQQREICDVRIAKMLGKFEHNAYDYNIDGRVLGVNISEFKGYMLLAGLCSEVLPAALDALEASMRREAEKDATIIRLTAERDAAVCDMFGCMSTQGQCVRCKKRYYCDGTDDDKFSPLCKNNSHCYAWEWRGLHADNTDAPTGAESEQNNESES